MPNNQNLKIHRSPSEARENGRKGGVASGEARREKASMRAAAEYLLSRKVPPGEMEDALEEMGIKKSDQTYATAVVAGAIRRAIDGNPAAFGQLMKLMGEGLERQEVTTPNEGALPNMPGMVQTDEKVRWGELKRSLRMAEDGTVIDAGTGLVVDGVEVVQGEDKFTVETEAA